MTKLSLNSKPLLREYLAVIPMGKDKLQVREGGKITIVEGESVPVVTKLLPLLNGSRTVEEIAENMENMSGDLLLDILERLNERGLIEDASIPPSYSGPEEELEYYREQLMLFSHFGNRYKYQERLRSSKALILGMNRIGTYVLLSLALSGVGHLTGVGSDSMGLQGDPMEGGLFSLEGNNHSKYEVMKTHLQKMNPYIYFEGINRSIHSKDDLADVVKGYDIVILCTEKPLITIYSWLNEACLQQKIQWISGSLYGSEGVVGPSILPGETPCYTCYQLRMKGNVDFYPEHEAFEQFLIDNPNTSVTYGSIPAFYSIVANHVALEAVKMITKSMPSSIYGNVYTIDFFTLRQGLHKVLKIPRCPSCGSLSRRPRKEPWEAR